MRSTAKIDELEKNLEEQRQLERVLGQQVAKQVNEAKQAERAVEVLEKEEAAIQVKMNEVKLENEAIDRAKQRQVAEKEELLVHHDLVKLESNRIRGVLNAKTEKVFNLENRKEQLRISMIEREKEIEGHQEVLKSNLKNAEGEKHKAALELSARKSRIENLKSKFDSLQAKMRNGPDGDGEVHSQAYYLLKAAQAKEELQRKGDELDTDIKKAAKEVRALENTLAHLTTRNQRYKDSFKKASNLSDSERVQKEMLEEQSEF